MRTLILNLLLLMSISVFAQDRYVSLRECNNDTLEYVRVNFTGDNIKKYVNQPFGKFADDFELGLYMLVKHVLSFATPCETSAIKLLYKNGRQFYRNEVKYPLYCCFIEFHQPHPFFIHYYRLKDKVGDNTAIREYFRRFVIKDMEFVLLLDVKDTSVKNPMAKFWYWKDLYFD